MFRELQQSLRMRACKQVCFQQRRLHFSEHIALAADQSDGSPSECDAQTGLGPGSNVPSEQGITLLISCSCDLPELSSKRALQSRSQTTGPWDSNAGRDLVKRQLFSLSKVISATRHQCTDVFNMAPAFF